MWPYFGIDDFFANKLLQRKNGQNFQCCKCGKWYSTRSIMLRHMNHGNLLKLHSFCNESHHFSPLISSECGVEKKIQCKLCFKKFRRKWNLEQHQKRIHRKHYKNEQETVIKYANENENNDEHDDVNEISEKSNL